ncbi:LysR substrate-binding domain-containing protein [Bradyrhizobium mercantei]|uniref:LysR substrate-binding domain-containing protein n=1 Tax=Bradyrhizobium mercantei TaxID=1904807 RepID=UPI0009784CCD|nr:LysR substrate-binding domain-containing protein [Bradyrhizobium mercantei]
MPLIRAGTSFLFEDAWPIWLKAAGVESLQPEVDPLTFEYALPAVEAAAFGLGVALGRSPFVDDDLKSGRLVRPFEQSVGTGLAYYVVSPLELASRPKVRMFRNWILDQFSTVEVR